MGCDAQRAIAVEPGCHHAMPTGIFLRDQRHGIGINLYMAQVDYGYAELKTENGDQCFLGQHAMGDQGVQKPGGPGFAGFSCGFQLLLGNEPAFQQDLAQPFFE